MSAHGMIAVDKMGTKVLFLDPVTYETQVTLDGFQKTVHELLVMPEAGVAYVPIFGDGTPQSESRPPALHHRPPQTGARGRHRSASADRAAYAKARTGRPDLHHL
jgi:hypothetical protein